ncbi:MAG: FecR family protein [Flavipsychrobacter sp.]
MNKNNKHINEELMVRYLLGETTNEENLLINARLETDTEYKKQFEDYRSIWDKSKNISATSNINVDAAWEKFVEKTQQTAVKETKTISFPAQRKSILKIAAAVLMLVFCGIIGYTIYQQPITIASNDNVLTETLPDGTIVTLNRNASITYPRNFEGDTRDVTLEGEAFFDVAPNKAKPFMITADETTVKVVGTSFNVKCSDAITEIVVETGIVSVTKKQNEVVLTPNEVAFVHKNKAKPVKQNNTDQLYNYYRTKEFICDGTPLWRLVDVLNEAYDTEIIIANNDLKNLPLNTTFHNKSLDYVLDVISETFNIHVIDNDGRKVLK